MKNLMEGSVCQQLRALNLPPLAEEPLVSVLVANYNYARFLPEALGSALNQTYSKLEVIVFDDGSTDDSCKVIKSFAEKDARINLIRHPNGGVASALNIAYEASKGHLIALLDADDVWTGDRLEKVVKKFQGQPQVGMVTHRLRVIDGLGRDQGALDFGEAYGAGWLAPILLAGKDPGFPPASGLTLRREVADRVFPLPTVFRKMADGVIRNRAATLAAVGTIAKRLGFYRIHNSNVSGFGKPLSAALVDYTIHLKELIQSDIVEFGARTHGVDSASLMPPDQLGSMPFSRAVLRREAIPRQEISAHASGLRRWIWMAAFTFPEPARARLYTWWCGRTFLRRVFRWVA